jgi:hypothetical protein
MVTIITPCNQDDFLSLSVNLILIIRGDEYETIWKKRKNTLEMTYLHIGKTPIEEKNKVEFLVHFAISNPFNSSHLIWIDNYHPVVLELVAESRSIPDKFRYPLHQLGVPPETLPIITGSVGLLKAGGRLLLQTNNSILSSLAELTGKHPDIFDFYLSNHDDPVKSYLYPELKEEVMASMLTERTERGFFALERFLETSNKANSLLRLSYLTEMIKLGSELGLKDKICHLAKLVIDLMTEEFLFFQDHIVRMKVESQPAKMV